jgi:hypothetical protein
MYIPYTTFRHSYHNCWGTCRSGAPVFCIPVEWCRLWCKPRSLSDTISWRSDREICGKRRESDEMVNHLFSWIFSSTARTKSSLTTGGRPLRGSSCTFSRLSIKCLTHLRTNESLMACSPYPLQSWRWMSAGFMFLAFKKRITDRISHAAGFSIFLNVVSTQDDA